MSRAVLQRPMTAEELVANGYPPNFHTDPQVRQAWYAEHPGVHPIVHTVAPYLPRQEKVELAIKLEPSEEEPTLWERFKTSFQEWVRSFKEVL